VAASAVSLREVEAQEVVVARAARAAVLETAVVRATVAACIA
jgi:hypothetical protein